ncbi:MAG: AtpZ/AtpI family protein [Deltaproteobacteria bacterium]
MAEVPKNKTSQDLGLAWSFGWPIAAGAMVGYWLDGYLSTAPWLALVFSLAAMVMGVVRMLALLDRDRD